MTPTTVVPFPAQHHETRESRRNELKFNRQKCELLFARRDFGMETQHQKRIQLMRTGVDDSRVTSLVKWITNYVLYLFILRFVYATNQSRNKTDTQNRERREKTFRSFECARANCSDDFYFCFCFFRRQSSSTISTVYLRMPYQREPLMPPPLYSSIVRWTQSAELTFNSGWVPAIIMQMASNGEIAFDEFQMRTDANEKANVNMGFSEFESQMFPPPRIRSGQSHGSERRCAAETVIETIVHRNRGITNVRWSVRNKRIWQTLKLVMLQYVVTSYAMPSKSKIIFSLRWRVR